MLNELVFENQIGYLSPDMFHNRCFRVVSVNPVNFMATGSRSRPRTDTGLIKSGSLTQASTMLVKSMLHNVRMFGEIIFSLF